LVGVWRSDIDTKQQIITKFKWEEDDMEKVILFLIAMFIVGCLTTKNNSNAIGGETKYSQGIEYKMVTIEGKRFIATPISHNYWTLEGPIE